MLSIFASNPTRMDTSNFRQAREVYKATCISCTDAFLFLASTAQLLGVPSWPWSVGEAGAPRCPGTSRRPEEGMPRRTS